MPSPQSKGSQFGHPHLACKEDNPKYPPSGKRSNLHFQEASRMRVFILVTLFPVTEKTDNMIFSVQVGKPGLWEITQLIKFPKINSEFS